MGLELIYNSYADGVPVLFTAGNHEGYEHPYGISPRIAAEEQGIKVNSGIPFDHNLTLYEAILLFGPTYHDYYKTNFFPENFDWIYTTLSPWKDVFIPYGDRQNFVMLGWGNDEKYLGNAVIGGDTLPVAKQAVTAEQETLLERAVQAANSDKNTLNILITHFTFAAYRREKPLFMDCYGKGLPLPGETLPEPLTASTPSVDGYSLDTGTFAERQNAVWEKVCKAFPYVISGHTHKAGLYHLELKTTTLAWDGSSIQHREITPFYAHNLDKPKDTPEAIDLSACEGTLALVSGSCGTFNKQNLFGELGGFGMDKPQGMVLNLHTAESSGARTGHTVSILRSSAPQKPRLAVALEYLWEDGKRLFTQVSCSVPNVPDTTLSGHILSPGLQQPFYFETPANLLTYFRTSDKKTTYGSFPTAVPVEYFKFHAVRSDSRIPVHMGCLRIECCAPEGVARQQLDIDGLPTDYRTYLNVTGNEMQQFLAYCREKNGEQQT